MSTASSTTVDMLFFLRIFASTTGDLEITDNSHDLWALLDQGWQLGPYEVMVADPAQVACHILIKLSLTTPPPSPHPPEKLFVLRPLHATSGSPYNDQTETKEGDPSLSDEINRGWELDGYKAVLQSPEAHLCFVLVKMKNPGNLTAVPPGHLQKRRPQAEANAGAIRQSPGRPSADT